MKEDHSVTIDGWPLIIRAFPWCRARAVRGTPAAGSRWARFKVLFDDAARLEKEAGA